MDLSRTTIQIEAKWIYATVINTARQLPPYFIFAILGHFTKSNFVVNKKQTPNTDKSLEQVGRRQLLLEK